MSMIIALIVISLLIAGGFLMAFIWAVKTDQYKDTESPAMRILFDDNTLDANDVDTKRSVVDDNQ